MINKYCFIKALHWPISLLFIISITSIYPQTKYDFPTLTEDTKSFIEQPSKWDGKDIALIAGTAGITYATMYIDEYVRETVLKNNQFKNSIPVEFGRIWGEPLATIFIGSSIYLHGLASQNDVNRKIGFEIGESALFTSIITIIFKYSFGRERPRENSDAFSYYPFSFKDVNFLSLNSGHTALAFSLSTVLAKNTSNDYLKVAFFIPAIMTAFSRVYQNHHWTSDVVLGGIIGYSVAEFVSGLHKKKSSSDKNQGLIEKPINLLNFTIPF